MKNRYDEYYTFRLATIDDVDAIMSFIHDEWGENHILAHDKKLFIWQYGSSEYGNNSKINVVLMLNKSDNSILGMIGYIPYSNDKKRLHISTAITKVKSDGLLPMAGIELMKRQTLLVGEQINFAHGTNGTTILPLFKKIFHHDVGIMQQYYMLNPKISKYNIASIKNQIYSLGNSFNYALRELNHLDEIDFNFNLNYSHLPYKSKEFINKRYFNHPIYTYRKWAIINESMKTVGLLIGREISQNSAKILRIVDYRGCIEEIYKLSDPLHKVLYENNYEYIDMMVSSLPEREMKSGGFVLLNRDGENIIPNYFEPFECKNITDNYQKNGDIIIFKADGDQDRPNIIPGVNDVQ